MTTIIQHELSTAENKLATIEHGLATAKHNLATAEQRLTSIEYRLTNTNHELTTAEHKFATAKNEHELAVTKHEHELAKLDNVEHRLTTAEHKLAATKQKLTTIKRELATAKHELTTTQHNHEALTAQDNNARARYVAKTKTKAMVTTLHHLATDCLRLSMHFFHPIQRCAQHIYHTSLPLSPTSSQLHKSYLQHVIDSQLSYVTAFSGAPHAWGMLLRTIDIRPKQLTCVTTSVQRIVAACGDIVNIYDAVTGVLRQSICTPEMVTKIQDSPDGSILFFAHSFSVTTWDVQTGGLINTFGTTQSKINDITVSPTHLACGSSDGTIVFWNTNTREKGKTFGNRQPVVTTYWLSSRELAVATQNTLYIRDIVMGRTTNRFSTLGCIWGMIYLEDEDKFLTGISRPGTGDQEETVFVTIEHIRRRSSEQQEPTSFRQSEIHRGRLSSPTLVGEEIVCITPASGVQLFNTASYNWTKGPPLLDTATSTAISLNRNLVVQTKDSIQIFSADVLTSSQARDDVRSSHVYPLGEKHVVCVIRPNRHLALLELETLRKLRHGDDTSQLWSPSALAPFSGRGPVAELGAPAVMEAWQSVTPLPEWAGVAGEDASLHGRSPACARVVTVDNSPQRGLRVKDVKRGTVLANLCLGDDDLGMGDVYDITFDSETRFYLKTYGPEGAVTEIPCDIIASPSGPYSHTVTMGKPARLPEPWVRPPYTLDTNCEWVLDGKSRKICWISPANLRRGDGGHFWAGLSLVMVGDDGVVRKLTFKAPDC